jgi:hypothetical protein
MADIGDIPEYAEETVELEYECEQLDYDLLLYGLSLVQQQFLARMDEEMIQRVGHFMQDLMIAHPEATRRGLEGEAALIGDPSEKVLEACGIDPADMPVNDIELTAHAVVEEYPDLVEAHRAGGDNAERATRFLVQEIQDRCEHEVSFQVAAQMFAKALKTDRDAVEIEIEDDDQGGP